jgi:hypothetical protein
MIYKLFKQKEYVLDINVVLWYFSLEPIEQRDVMPINKKNVRFVLDNLFLATELSLFIIIALNQLNNPTLQLWLFSGLAMLSGLTFLFSLWEKQSKQDDLRIQNEPNHSDKNEKKSEPNFFWINLVKLIISLAIFIIPIQRGILQLSPHILGFLFVILSLLDTRYSNVSDKLTLNKNATKDLSHDDHLETYSERPDPKYFFSERSNTHESHHLLKSFRLFCSLGLTVSGFILPTYGIQSIASVALFATLSSCVNLWLLAHNVYIHKKDTSEYTDKLSGSTYDTILRPWLQPPNKGHVHQTNDRPQKKTGRATCEKISSHDLSNRSQQTYI